MHLPAAIRYELGGSHIYEYVDGVYPAAIDPGQLPRYQEWDRQLMTINTTGRNRWSLPS
jgi:hypothetical protein